MNWTKESIKVTKIISIHLQQLVPRALLILTDEDVNSWAFSSPLLKATPL